MKGDIRVIESLNRVLAQELSAINQYFIHARFFESSGLDRLGKLEYRAALDEMKHADSLIKRILFLEGVPNISEMQPAKIGSDVAKAIALDLKSEREAVVILREVIALAEKAQDYTTRVLFTNILANEEEHIDWLETQEELISRMGLENYIQSSAHAPLQD